MNAWSVVKQQIRSRVGRVMHAVLGISGSLAVLLTLWHLVLVPLRWPPPQLVLHYFCASLSTTDTYLALFMSSVRAATAMSLGFSMAVVLAVLTGRTRLGWICFFFLLMAIQKIPGIALTHVLVQSKLGIGFLMTTVLGATVVMSFVWLVLHHRAASLNEREVFALRVVGFRGWRLALYGLLPHLGSTLGGAARLAMSIAIIMVVLGEWQGVWSDGTLWEFGLGVSISRAYEAVDSQARVLALCAWLGILGIIMDVLVQLALLMMRAITGVELSR